MRREHDRGAAPLVDVQDQLDDVLAVVRIEVSRGLVGRGAELSSKSDWSLIRRSIRMAPSCAPKHERELTKCRDFVSQNH